MVRQRKSEYWLIIAPTCALPDCPTHGSGQAVEGGQRRAALDAVARANCTYGCRSSSASGEDCFTARPIPMDNGDEPLGGTRDAVAKLLSINVGLPRDIQWQGRTVRTAVWKEPIAGRCWARRLNIE